MTLLTSDGLRLLIGDGATPELFLPLRAALIHRMEINQQVLDQGAIRNDPWAVGFGISDQRIIMECEALASDESAENRLRTLALYGTSGNFQMELNSSEKLTLRAYVTQYLEITQPGEVKRLRCRIESTHHVSVV